MEQSTDLTPIEKLRQQMIISMSSTALTLLAQKENTNTWLAEQVRQYVDTFLSGYQINTLIPVHVPHPLSDHVLTKISRGGKVTRTVRVEAEDFFPYEDEVREECINEVLIENGAGVLTDITWRQVGHSYGEEDGETILYAYLEVTGTYTSSGNAKPRGRGKGIPVEIGKGRKAFTDVSSHADQSPHPLAQMERDE